MAEKSHGRPAKGGKRHPGIGFVIVLVPLTVNAFIVAVLLRYTHRPIQPGVWLAIGFLLCLGIGPIIVLFAIEYPWLRWLQRTKRRRHFRVVTTHHDDTTPPH